jgi:hypothetical protein
VIEATAGTAARATTATPAQKVGNSITGALDKLNRALQNAEKGEAHIVKSGYLFGQ